MPNCSAIVNGEWFGSMMPPEPTRIVVVAAATCASSTEVAADAQSRGLELATAMAKGASVALGDARRLLRAGWSGTREDVSAQEATTIGSRVTSPEAQALIDAFLKR